MTPRLGWVLEFQASMNRATDGQFESFTILPDASPLKISLRFDLRESLMGKDYHSFFMIAHAFAAANECVLERVRRGYKMVTLEIAMKRRLGPPMNNNPMLATKKS